MSPRFLGAAETAAAALGWCLVVVGLSVLCLTVPVYTSALTQALGVPASSGLSNDDVVALSGAVRAFVADARPEPLPATWRGRPAFDAAAVSHLADVRAVISGARFATGLTSLLLAVYVAWCIAARRFDRLRAGMRAGAWSLAGVVVLAGVAAVTDFESFFARFHGLFFAAGTWTFPYDSLLIRLFPEAFWASAGASWAALTAVGAALLAGGSRMLRAALVHKNASRTAKAV